jgi:hypothetical protein
VMSLYVSDQSPCNMRYMLPDYVREAGRKTVRPDNPVHSKEYHPRKKAVNGVYLFERSLATEWYTYISLHYALHITGLCPRRGDENSGQTSQFHSKACVDGQACLAVLPSALFVLTLGRGYPSGVTRLGFASPELGGSVGSHDQIPHLESLVLIEKSQRRGDGVRGEKPGLFHQPSLTS